jgi:hypothetical protein
MKKYFFILMIFTLISCSQNAIKEDNTTKDNTSKNTGEVLSEKKSDIKLLQEKTEISQDQVKSVFKNLTLKITEKSNNKSYEVTAPVGEKYNIDNTMLAIEIVGYYPDFVMDETNGAITKSLEERNPTAKVNIYKNDKIVFKGWLFANFPDIHAFEDSDYDVKLAVASKEE